MTNPHPRRSLGRHPPTACAPEWGRSYTAFLLPPFFLGLPIRLAFLTHLTLALPESFLHLFSASWRFLAELLPVDFLPVDFDTHMVADINPGAAGSEPYYLAGFDGEVFFAATTSVTARSPSPPTSPTATP